MADMAKGPSHVTTGNVFKDIGFGADEALRLKVKCDLAITLSKTIRELGLTAKEVSEVLKVPQKKAALLIKGDVDVANTDALIGYIGALGKDLKLKVSDESR